MEKKINRFIKLPLIIICIVITISGLRWLISHEPWILDQVANEERLAMTFNELFLIDGNNTLAAYLKQIYRFLGLYVFGTGFVNILINSEETAVYLAKKFGVPDYLLRDLEERKQIIAMAQQLQQQQSMMQQQGMMPQEGTMNEQAN